MLEEITLSTCALKLRNSDPEIFELFVNELEKYYGTLMDAMVQSGINDVLVAQGRTQSIQVVLRTLKTCHVERKEKPLPAHERPFPVPTP